MSTPPQSPSKNHWAGRVVGWDPQAFTNARLDSGMTFEQLRDRLAERGVEVSTSTLHAWSYGRRPRQEYLREIARVLRVRMDKLRSL